MLYIHIYIYIYCVLCLLESVVYEKVKKALTKKGLKTGIQKASTTAKNKLSGRIPFSS